MPGLPERPTDALDPSAPLASPLRDAHGRTVTYLRLSLTERCNFRCGYCTPPDSRFDGESLGAEELVRLVGIFARLGVRRVRLTGGEPLLRRDVLEIARGIRALPGIAELAMTTNGHLLERMAGALLEAGVTKLNISLDSLDPDRFKRLTGGAGSLDRLLAGIAACLNARFDDVKLNTVIVRGENDGEAADIIRYAWSKGIVARFIECMPFSHGRPVPTLELIERIRRDGIDLRPESEVSASRPSGPSEYWTGDGGRVGFIRPLTRCFCGSCNRVRVASNGDLRACLGGTQTVPLAPLLRGENAEAEVARAVRWALQRKPEHHSMTVPDAGRKLLSMRSIGG
ncbi:MAG: GTP 3',8-cyclase MoaA [Myxococcales bacterium]